MFNRKPFIALLDKYLPTIEEDITSSSYLFGPTSELHSACVYSLQGGGKRFRPLLVHMMGEALGGNEDVRDAALAVEFFHTASLIADDLPCMDDDDQRRSRPSLHRAFNEATALLASYALIAAGYELIARGAAKNSVSGDLICQHAVLAASRCTGVLGATGGQYLDLYPDSTELGFIEEVMEKKTGSLFEISFVLGWIFGGGSLASLDLVRKASHHFGLAFQIADDIDDLNQDMTPEKESVNLALRFGLDAAQERVAAELSSFYDVVKELGVSCEEFKILGEQLCCPPEVTTKL